MACDDRSEPAVDERPLRIRALDGYELGAVLYSARAGAETMQRLPGSAATRSSAIASLPHLPEAP